MSDDVKPYTREEFFGDEAGRRMLVDVAAERVIVPLDQWARICETVKAYSAGLADTEQALTILRDMYDPESCRFDHHGHCQEHGWYASPAEDLTDKTDRGVCPHRRAQQLFTAIDKRRHMSSGHEVSK